MFFQISFLTDLKIEETKIQEEKTYKKYFKKILNEGDVIQTAFERSDLIIFYINLDVLLH